MAEQLQQIADHLRVMLASATELHDGLGGITGYQIKTGALHRILGVLSGAGHPVSIPAVPNKSVSLPDGRITVAYVTTTDAGWAQLWVHGVILRSAYGQQGQVDLEQQAARVNAAVGVAPLQAPSLTAGAWVARAMELAAQWGDERVRACYTDGDDIDPDLRREALRKHLSGLDAPGEGQR